MCHFLIRIRRVRGPKHRARDHSYMWLPTLLHGQSSPTKVSLSPNPALWDILGSIRQGGVLPQIGSSLDSTGSLFSLGKPSVLELVGVWPPCEPLVYKGREIKRWNYVSGPRVTHSHQMVLGCLPFPNLICFLPSCVSLPTPPTDTLDSALQS